MRRLLLSITTCCLMTACVSGALPTPAPEPIPVKPEANLTAVPLPLPQPATGRIQDLEANHVQVARAYHQLASQVCRLLVFLQVPTEGCELWTRNSTN